jgi:phosphopantothenoylcysteine decarboxylase/phosphopantothenate--cysteine ligase
VEVGGLARPPGGGKIESDSAPVLRLRPHPKLVDSLRARSLNESLRVVAFKLTHGSGADEARSAIAGLFEHSGADVVVHNDSASRSGKEAFPSEIHFASGSPPERCETRRDLAAAIERILVGLPAAEAALA